MIAAPDRTYRRSALLPPPTPDEAARGYLAFAAEWGSYGETPWSGPDGVWAEYLWYCRHVARCHPVPDNLFAHALGELVPARQVNDYSTGKRRRLTVYLLPDPDDAPAGSLRGAGDCPAGSRPPALRMAA